MDLALTIGFSLTCAWMTACSGSSSGAVVPNPNDEDGGSAASDSGATTIGNPDGGGGADASAPKGSTSLNALVPSLANAPAGGCTASTEGDEHCDFFKYVAPHVAGVSTFLYWSQIDHGASACVEGSADHPCDWTAFDATVSEYVNAGLTVNLIVIGVNEGGMSNQGTPAYVFTPAYATSLGAAPQDMVTCGLWPGGKNSPVQGSMTVSGIWNHDACTATGGSCNGSAPYTDTNGFPVVYEKPFMTGYQGFIANVLKHYSASGSGSGPALASKIGYARFGMTAGGETQLFCQTVWPGVAGMGAAPDQYSKTLFVGSASDPSSGYISSMANFIHAQHSKIPSLINAHVGPPANSDLSYADEEAQIAVANEMGFGMEALSIADPYQHALGKPCNDDWCAGFEANAKTGLPLVLQSTIPTTSPTFGITTISGDGKSATVTCATDCDFYTGNSGWVTVSGNSNAAFNGTFQIKSVASTSTFTFASTTNASGNGGSLENPDYLPTTIPFAVSEHASALEIYLCDLFYAFDPNAVANEKCSTPPGASSSLYAATLTSVFH
jgi:hypothetical protein